MYHVGIDERHEHESPANSRYDGVRTLRRHEKTPDEEPAEG